MDGVRALSTRLGVHKIAALIERAQSDAIVCTHFLNRPTPSVISPAASTTAPTNAR
jgi:hypothetical protein